MTVVSAIRVDVIVAALVAAFDITAVCAPTFTETILVPSGIPVPVIICPAAIAASNPVVVLMPVIVVDAIAVTTLPDATVPPMLMLDTVEPDVIPVP